MSLRGLGGTGAGWVAPRVRPCIPGCLGLPGAECRQKPASSLWWEKVEECWAGWCLLRSWWQLFRGELQASLLRGRRDLPGPGIEPVFPALAGGFLSSVPPGEVHDGNSQPLFYSLDYSFMPLAFVPTFSQCDVTRKIKTLGCYC